MGIRGIPANYGGFETFAEELTVRLVDRGHDVWVYCRTNNVTHPGDLYRGVHLVKLPTIGTKHLDTPVHTLLSVAHGLGMRFDAVLVCNAANAFAAWVPRLGGAKVALNVDGIERLRKKWGRAGRAWYHLGERLATVAPNEIVSDADVIHDYYLEHYGAESTMIPYGADSVRVETHAVLDGLGLRPREYVLYVTRFEPENNPHLLIEAFSRVTTSKRLVIVGDAPHAEKYRETLQELAARDSRVLLPGFVYGDGYRELQSHAYCYVQASEVGGTHPALIEAMGAGNLVIANGTPENREVLGDAGLLYDVNDVDDLAAKLQWAMEADAVDAEAFRRSAFTRVREHYSWDAVTDRYAALFASMASG